MQLLETARLRWVVDEAIPQTPSLKHLMGETTIVSGREITPSVVAGTDILLVRSVTCVDKSLLEGSCVQFVGTATTGVDHVDTGWLEDRGIAFVNAAGANSNSVVEYVMSAIAVAGYFPGVLHGDPVGIIGLGRIGEALARRLLQLGAQVLVYDPLRLDWPLDIPRGSYEAVLRQPVITLHANLHDRAPNESRGLLGDREVSIMLDAFNKRDRRGLFINSARGELISFPAVDTLSKAGFSLVLDTWPGEPKLCSTSLRRCDWVSPHIAGHSLCAKYRASNMLSEEIARWFGVEEMQSDMETVIAEQPDFILDAPDLEPDRWVTQFLIDRSTLPQENERVRTIACPDLTATEFDHLRQSYNNPLEWTGGRIRVLPNSNHLAAVAENLGLHLMLDT